MSSCTNRTGNVKSFRKKGTDSVNIRGTRVFTQNAQLITSTGSSTLDFFIGGGLAVGTVCLIEEDCHNTYSNILVKYFLTEGVANNHRLFLSSGDKLSKNILKELPSIKVPEVKVENNIKDSALKEELKIAWRYQNQQATFASGIKAYSHNHGFDLSKTLSEELLQSCSITTWDPSEKSQDYFGIDQNFITFPMSYLLQRISSEITSNGFRTSSKGCDNIMRIAVTSLCSPLWHSGSEKKQELNIIRFLYLLKALLRTSYAVAVVTVPSYIVQDKILISRIRQICDTVISLECFVGSDKKSNPLFKEYNGLIQIVKLPILNTFIYPIQMTDLAFKLKRKDFVIERLHLPPDFEEAQEDAGSFGCSGKPSKLDF
ncbi:elongator complex protein 4 [Trichonephila inaurata madagascariensis]|uniref:Elongator complex protein 4 n=1 Tax=Trichonephila inaurata madagascariensis TaxID=2747483 RepID=A0A8X7C577_9ARAC|nr:elongator complex protein 4 [Trichonephila inaurata madagascariensis]